MPPIIYVVFISLLVVALLIVVNCIKIVPQANAYVVTHGM